MQSCLSPIWDTALTALALVEGGMSPDHPTLKDAMSWLVEQQILTGGDWQVNSCPPGGWAFEFVNTRYPDVDDLCSRSEYAPLSEQRSSRSH